jgi:hypothetical protein
MHMKVLAVLGLLTFIPEAAAQTVKELDDTPPWTPERYQNAVPLELPTVDAPVDALGAADATRRTRQYMRPGSSEDEADVVAPDPHYELFPMDGKIELETKAAPAVRTGWGWAPAPRDFGDAEALYSSSRLIPRSAREARPYRAAGKLFGTIPGSGEFECSAAVIAPRLVLTAGHCVHDGSGGADGFFEDFVFVPAYERATLPTGSGKVR